MTTTDGPWCPSGDTAGPLLKKGTLTLETITTAWLLTQASLLWSPTLRCKHGLPRSAPQAHTGPPSPVLAPLGQSAAWDLNVEAAVAQHRSPVNVFGIREPGLDVKNSRLVIRR